jgi:hypothetical protein
MKDCNEQSAFSILNWTRLILLNSLRRVQFKKLIVHCSLSSGLKFVAPLISCDDRKIKLHLVVTGSTLEVVSGWNTSFDSTIAKYYLECSVKVHGKRYAVVILQNFLLY